jgi:hypothetical protein
MALPPPIYLDYRPQSFLAPAEGGVMDLALKLYTKYHPAAVQQRLYERLLESEAYKAGKEDEKYQLLQEELTRLRGNLSSFRDAEAATRTLTGGRQATFGGRKGSGAGGGDDKTVFDKMLAIAELDTELLVAREPIRARAWVTAEQMFEPTRPQHNFIASVKMREDSRKSESAGDLELSLRNRWTENRAFQTEKLTATPTQKKAAAEQMFSWLRIKYPDYFYDVDAEGVYDTSYLNEWGVKLVGQLDDLFGAKQWLVRHAIDPATDPASEISRSKKEIRFDMIRSEAAEPEGLEEAFQEARKGPRGRQSTAQRVEAISSEARAQREALGIGEPLSTHEELFLSRWIDALRDDGRATREELGEDYAMARAAYERAKTVEQLPRGAAPFFEAAYLADLQRAAQVEKEIGQRPDRDSPQQIAAQRAMDPRSTRYHEAAFQAAARVSPIAAESLPAAMRRVKAAKGKVEPKTKGEIHAQQLINAQATTRDFNAFHRELRKATKGDEKAYREGLAYFGAFYYVRDAENRTTSRGAATADPELSASEAQLFQQEVSSGDRRKQYEQMMPDEPADALPGLLPAEDVEYPGTRRGGWSYAPNGR